MRFYNRQHRHYCGIDLHVKTMYVCVLDAAGQVLVHRNVQSTPEAFLETVAPYREDLVVVAECMFTWYWLADVCAEEGIAFVLGHALAMKAIHSGKAKNDKIDSHQIASLLRGGLLPQARKCRRDIVAPLVVSSDHGPLAFPSKKRLHGRVRAEDSTAALRSTITGISWDTAGRRLSHEGN